MTSAAGSVLASLKGKMQTLRDELDKTRDDMEEKERDLEMERAKRAEVGLVCFSSAFFVH